MMPPRFGGLGMKKVLSINAVVQVVLTEKGAEILNEKSGKKEYVAGQTFGRVPLWELMWIFGPKMDGGMSSPFLGGAIYD